MFTYNIFSKCFCTVIFTINAQKYEHQQKYKLGNVDEVNDEQLQRY